MKGQGGKEGEEGGEDPRRTTAHITPHTHTHTHTCSNKAATRSLSYIHPRACRRACRSPRLLNPIILSTYFRTALARISVVLMRPWRMAGGREGRREAGEEEEGGRVS